MGGEGVLISQVFATVYVRWKFSAINISLFNISLFEIAQKKGEQDHSLQQFLVMSLCLVRLFSFPPEPITLYNNNL